MEHEETTLYKGASCAAWGYFFLYIDINLNSVSILPRFVGYLFFLSAIHHWKEACRDLVLLRPLATLLAVWYGIDWLLSWGGGDMSEVSRLLTLITDTALLYFHFQFLTDCAALAKAYQQEEETLDSRLLRLRTLQTALLTTLTVLSYGQNWLGEVWELIVTLLIFVNLVSALLLVFAMFALRKALRQIQVFP